MSQSEETVSTVGIALVGIMPAYLGGSPFIILGGRSVNFLILTTLKRQRLHDLRLPLEPERFGIDP
jgi:hypothetical protein